jgi:ribose 5-phosphate isomerase B
MKIALGTDHRGRDVARHLEQLLMQQRHEVSFLFEGPNGCSDYPDAAWPVAQAVATGQADRGVLICGSGIGMSIAANKVRGIRAALVHDEVGADMSRRHNDANVLCLPADLLGQRLMERILNTFLATGFDGGRHARRIEKIAAIENGEDPRSRHFDPVENGSVGANSVGANSVGVDSVGVDASGDSGMLTA